MLFLVHKSNIHNTIEFGKLKKVERKRIPPLKDDLSYNVGVFPFVPEIILIQNHDPVTLTKSLKWWKGLSVGL